ncbi:hypothetical protein, partial [Bacillus toyonensis]|uniref:hypothetical protein n=1 Tax=Bacillus toyonensis TaxID=155322 RepID=UPI002DB64DDC
LTAIPCPKPIHLPPTHFAFLEEGVFLAKMIKKRIGNTSTSIKVNITKLQLIRKYQKKQLQVILVKQQDLQNINWQQNIC